MAPSVSNPSFQADSIVLCISRIFGISTIDIDIEEVLVKIDDNDNNIHIMIVEVIEVIEVVVVVVVVVEVVVELIVVIVFYFLTCI